MDCSLNTILTQAPSQAISAGFMANPANMTVPDAINAYDAFRTLFNVASGLLCQPRFCRAADDTTTPGGDKLEDAWESLAGQLDELRRFIQTSRCSDARHEAARRAFLVTWELENGGEVADAILSYARGILQD